MNGSAKETALKRAQAIMEEHWPTVLILCVDSEHQMSASLGSDATLYGMAKLYSDQMEELKRQDARKID